jgi:hypothetical protein
LRRSGCVRPSAQRFRSGVGTAIRLMVRTFVGHQTIDRVVRGTWATVPRQCCRPTGRSCDGEPRDVAPVAGSNDPNRCGSPSALPSGRGMTIRTSEPDRLRPAGSLNRGQPRRVATSEVRGSARRQNGRSPGGQATRVRMWPGAGPGSQGAPRWASSPSAGPRHPRGPSERWGSGSCRTQRDPRRNTVAGPGGRGRLFGLVPAVGADTRPNIGGTR